MVHRLVAVMAVVLAVACLVAALALDLGSRAASLSAAAAGVALAALAVAWLALGAGRPAQAGPTDADRPTTGPPATAGAAATGPGAPATRPGDETETATATADGSRSEAGTTADPGLIDLRDASPAEIRRGVAAGETALIEVLMADGDLSPSGPITDSDARTMLFVALSTADLLAALLDGEPVGLPEGDQARR